MIFRQPAEGYRAAIDPVLLAASVPNSTAGRVLDLGCGAGAAALCLARRREDLSVVGLERDPAIADIARANVTANGFTGRVNILTGDLLFPPPGLQVASFDAVIANPPFLDPDTADPSPVPAKAAATVEGEATLNDWCRAAARLAKPQGLVIFIHRADRLPDLKAALEKAGCGGLATAPLWPRSGQPPKRVIVIGKRGDRSPASTVNGLILHDYNNAYTRQTDTILREGAPLTVIP